MTEPACETAVVGGDSLTDELEERIDAVDPEDVAARTDLSQEAAEAYLDSISGEDVQDFVRWVAYELEAGEANERVEPGAWFDAEEFVECTASGAGVDVLEPLVSTDSTGVPEGTPE